MSGWGIIVGNNIYHSVQKIQEERYSRGEIKSQHIKTKNSPLKVLDEHLDYVHLIR
jgi:hypothetical protein